MNKDFEPATACLATPLPSSKTWTMITSTASTASRTSSRLDRSGFGEQEGHSRGGIIREYESITRVQGETVHQFTGRFIKLETKLKDYK
eukprot:3940316-Heterocapsa_arctica.AAC.1